MSILRDECLPRIYFDQPVVIEVEGTGELLGGRALNLSCGGIFVRCEKLLPEGARVLLGFAVPDRDPICTAATVLRTVRSDDPREPGGMALRFEDLPARALRDIDAYLQTWLRPAEEQRVRLQLGELGFAITASPQSCWGQLLAVCAELPFLRVGEQVKLLDEHGTAADRGSIRWVSVQVPPETGVPRLHIGIELQPQSDLAETVDPVCCAEFVEDAHQLDSRLRAERKLTPARA